MIRIFCGCHQFFSLRGQYIIWTTLGVFDKNGLYLTTHLAQKPAHKNKPSNHCTILLLQIRHRRTAVNFDLLLFHNGLKPFLKKLFYFDALTIFESFFFCNKDLGIIYTLLWSSDQMQLSTIELVDTNSSQPAPENIKNCPQK